jgi:hypothetical protein
LSTRWTILVVAVFAIAMLAAGCGGSDESSGGGTPSTTGSTSTPSSSSESSGGGSLTASSLSKDEYIKQASEACEVERGDLLPKIAAYTKKHESENLPKAVLLAKMIKATLVPTVEAEIEAIRELGAPAGDEEKIERILEAQQAAADRLKKAKSLKSIEQAEEFFSQPTEMLHAYGFESCASSS